MGTVLSGILDVLYPPRCVGCERGIAASEQPLCVQCMSGLERVDADELARHVRTNIPGFAARSIFALWMFDKGGTLQRAQHLLKYGQRPAFGNALGAALAAGWSAFVQELPDLVVPVPLHRTRQLERGYNQSLALARGICNVLHVGLAESALHRTSVTRRQTGLTRLARQDNVRGAFSASVDVLSGKRVMLVDDVVTTGATASAAIEAMLGAGARSIDFVALAHART